MNAGSFGRQASAALPAPGAAGNHETSLHSELARLCLPTAFKDVHRKLAWANSICFLFLAIGLVGLKPPEIVVRPLPEVTEVVPVVFVPPAEPPPAEAAAQDEPTEILQDVPVETPQVVTVVSPDVSVAFPVPIEGPVIVAPSAQFVPPPPRELPKPTPNPGPPKPVRFQPGRDGGRYPDPSYPRAALLARQQGRVLLSIVVDPNGVVTSSEVKDSSGYRTLDAHAARWVRTNWQFPPGETRYYECEIVFQIQ